VTRAIRPVPLLAGLGVALAVVLGIRTVHGWLVLDVPIEGAWVNTTALVVAALALALSYVRRPRLARPRPHPPATAAATALAALSIAVWGNLGTVQLPYHRWEQFHYFIGAKYFPELGYTRLYQCTAIAEAERFGRAAVTRRTIRDLTTDTLVPAATALDDPDVCRAHFAPARWQAFADDVAWFRRDCPSTAYWERMQTDHGFNPPPPWTVSGFALASVAPASATTQAALAALDPLLLAAAFALVGWAFGAHVLMVTLVVWGCNFPGKGVWTIGGFLRQDWLFAVIASVCLARRGRWLPAGLAFATSAALRIFPALLLAMPVALAARRWRRTGRLTLAHRRFAAGLLLGGGFWFVAATATFGWRAWEDFAAHMALHRNAPLANDLGLRALLSQTVEGRLARTQDDTAVDPFLAWKAARKATFAARRPAYWTLVAGTAVLVIGAAGRVQRLWVAIAASVVVIAVLVDLASYYYAIVVLLALLAATGRTAERLALGAVVVGRAVNAWPWLEANPDVRYLAQSWVLLLWGGLAVVVAARIGYRRPRLPLPQA
jgi:hypothetical protein